jgi:hypothetical protein
MLAMLRTVKASPGSRPRVTDGHTRESAHANTMYCTHTANHHRVSNGEKDRYPVPLPDADETHFASDYLIVNDKQISC